MGFFKIKMSANNSFAELNECAENIVMRTEKKKLFSNVLQQRKTMRLLRKSFKVIKFTILIFLTNT